jgi:hypothetical protein
LTGRLASGPSRFPNLAGVRMGRLYRSDAIRRGSQSGSKLPHSKEGGGPCSCYRAGSLCVPVFRTVEVRVTLEHAGQRCRITARRSSNRVPDVASPARPRPVGTFGFQYGWPDHPNRSLAHFSGSSREIGLGQDHGFNVCELYSARGELIQSCRVGIAHRREHPRPKTVGDAHPSMAHSVPRKL